MIRMFGLVLFLLGGWVVTSDFIVVAKYGVPEATMLAAITAITQWSGGEAWQAFALWILPAVTGVLMLLVTSPATLPRRPRSQHWPGT